MRSAPRRSRPPPRRNPGPAGPRRECPTIESLVAATLRPERPRLPEALAIARRFGLRPSASSQPGGAEEAAMAAELWEAYAGAGLIPASWIGDSARTFAEGMSLAPVRRIDAAMLAADAEGVATAETLCHEAYARLVPFSVQPADRATTALRHMPAAAGVDWQAAATTTRETFRGAPTVQNRPGLFQLLFEIAQAADDQRGFYARVNHERALGASRPYTEAEGSAVYDALLAAEYDVAASRGGVVPPSWGPRYGIAAAGRELATLPNPLAPWLEAACLGYVPRGVGMMRQGQDRFQIAYASAPYPRRKVRR